LNFCSTETKIFHLVVGIGKIFQKILGNLKMIPTLCNCVISHFGAIKKSQNLFYFRERVILTHAKQYQKKKEK